MKLTKAQRELLLDAPCSCVESYAPGRKLVALGLAYFAPYSCGGTMLKLTAQGTEAQRAETTSGSVHDGPVGEAEAPNDQGND